MCSTHLQLKDHVEHAIRAVGLQQFHDVRVFQHVADTGLSLQIWQTEIKQMVVNTDHINQIVHSSVIPVLLQTLWGKIIKSEFYI